MLITNLVTLVLAGFVGFFVISKVPNTLHTPLMSGTNAIHGIVVLGGIIVLGLGVEGWFSKLLLGEDGELALNFDDEVVAGACVVREGEAVQA